MTTMHKCVSVEHLTRIRRSIIIHIANVLALMPQRARLKYGRKDTKKTLVNIIDF